MLSQREATGERGSERSESLLGLLSHRRAVRLTHGLEDCSEASTIQGGHGPRGPQPLGPSLVIVENIGDEGARALEEALKQNATLMNLDMNRTSIGDEGVCALGLDTELCLTRSPFIPYHST